MTLVDDAEDGETVPLDCYVGYSSATYEWAYFEFSRLNADIEATVKQRGAGEGRDVQ